MLGSYIRQNMRFFVAKVNLKEQAKLGFSDLRPIQVAYESPKFMLPIRLGMVNANGPQDLFVYALTRNGRVETTNYRTVKLPSDVEVPLFVKDGFRALLPRPLREQVRRRDAARCSSSTPGTWTGAIPARRIRSSRDELRRPGRLLAAGTTAPPAAGGRVPHAAPRSLRRGHFPEDLVFQETADQSTSRAAT